MFLTAGQAVNICKVPIVVLKTVMLHKEGVKKMKRVLSWVVLIICTVVVYLVQTLAYNIAMYLIQWFFNSSTIMKVILVLFGGGTILALAYMPIVYGASLSVLASELVCPSRNDLRYIMWGTAYMLLCIVSFAVTLLVGSFNIATIAGALYGLALIIIGAKHRKELTA